jgi:N-acetylneuraminate synthase
MAHAFIDAAARAGVDAVKFQTHIASAESTRGEPWRVPLNTQDSTRYDYWKRMEFTEGQWRALARHAEERGLCFLSSPFSDEAAALLTRVGVTAWKIGSGEINNVSLFSSIMETRLPVLMSTGMSGVSEIDAAVDRLRKAGVQFAVLQCTSEYPCPPERVGLNLVAFFRERYRCPVGLSDHSGTIFPGLAAASLGVDILELHFTLSREMFGPDVRASVTTDELAELVRGVRFIERMRANPVNKDDMSHSLQPVRDAFMHSIALRRPLPAGAALSAEELVLKKPGTGLSPDRLPEIIGRRLCRSVAADHILLESDLEDA